ncbi:DUF4265 domain-containing protein [Mycolicibacterium fluoranthenivorans]|uniref:DUF4265 domain-containing protein n=1 Tax=Mycolicibacterium fluoranthenivorans TaxID=258505 RepID=A0A7X5R4G6_9MYCO|nr:DUF4265 domain-containing protein [Mycolicibacterium fluoranthenivorans]NIH93177.1 hypothetical protein [Mycolicibacterium fluoranthenivorans]
MAHERIDILTEVAVAATPPHGALSMLFKVDTDDDHSWPPADWEALWVRPESDGQAYRILSIPLLVFGIAVDDLVLGTSGPEGNVVFDRKVESGGHSTIRIFIDHQAEEDILSFRIAAIIDEVEAAGCVVRRTGWDLIVAVDIPTLDAYEHVYDDCLIPRGEAGELTVESACMTFDT